MKEVPTPCSHCLATSAVSTAQSSFCRPSWWAFTIHACIRPHFTPKCQSGRAEGSRSARQARITRDVIWTNSCWQAKRLRRWRSMTLAPSLIKWNRPRRTWKCPSSRPFATCHFSVRKTEICVDKRKWWVILRTILTYATLWEFTRSCHSPFGYS